MATLNTQTYDENIQQTEHFDIIETNNYSEEKIVEFKTWLDIEKNKAKEEQNKKIDNLMKKLSIKSVLDWYILKEWGRNYLQEKFWEIENFYWDLVTVIEMTKLDDSQKILENMWQYLDINKNKTQTNLNKLIEICKTLWNRTGEHIFALMGNDWAIHLINDIDTGHYIIPKELIESWDIWNLAKPIIVNEIRDWKVIQLKKMARWGKQIENFQKIKWKNELLEIWKNEPLRKI